MGLNLKWRVIINVCDHASKQTPEVVYSLNSVIFFNTQEVMSNDMFLKGSLKKQLQGRKYKDAMSNLYLHNTTMDSMHW